MQFSMFDGAGDVIAQKPEVSAQSNNGASIKKDRRDYAIADDTYVITPGAKGKFKANVEAIKLVNELTRDGRKATQEEQDLLVRFAGWEQLPQALDDNHVKWVDERATLHKILTPAEFQAAALSTVNAHSTRPDVIRAKWKILEHMGFQDGPVLEPSMGIGHYFGLMPNRSKSALYGVELDKLSGRIARQLYQSADIQICGLQEARFDTDFDLIISNVPFGNYPIIDHELYRGEYRHLSKIPIHNYFFLKSAGLLNDGGVIAFITSAFTMDSIKYTNVRETLADTMTLLGAIRLPANTFTKNAGTHVTTDIIFLQKGGPSRHNWLETVNHNGYRINKYFKDNPQMIIGQMQVDNRRFEGKWECVVPENFDMNNIEAAILNKLEWLPANVFPEQKASISMFIPKKPTFIPNNPKPWYRDGTYLLDDRWRVWQNNFGKYELVDHHRISVIRDYTHVRDSFRKVLEANLHDSDIELASAQAELARVYYQFIGKHSYLNLNRAAIKDDPDSPAVCALEIWDADTGTAKKSDFFTKRVIRQVVTPTSVDNPIDALAISLNEYGSINFNRMFELLGVEEDDRDVPALVAELGDTVYEQPDGAVIVGDEYLSGNVRRKLAEARNAAQNDNKFNRNVTALEEVLPRDLEPKEIYAPMGAFWIPDQYINEFVNEHIFQDAGWYRDRVDVEYLDSLGKWIVDTNNMGAIGWSSENTKKWGTTRVKATKLIEHALRGKVPTVKDTIETPDGEKQVKNEKETFAAREKLHLIKEEFDKWLWVDPEQAEDIARIYNDKFNSFVPRTYDGSHMTYPGMNPDITLKPIQSNAAWRIIQEPATLVGHSVGYGKTFTSIAASMKMLQLGIANKVMIVTKKSVLEKFLEEIYHLYPDANVLPVNNLSPAERKRTMARVAMGSHGIILTTHQTFEKMPLKAETRRRFYNEQLSVIIQAKESAKRGSVTLKELKKAEERIRAKINDLESLGQVKDNSLTLEESGINVVIIDESQKWKNLWYPTSMTRIPGIGGTESGMAFDGFMKAKWLLENGGKIAFLTGTSIENTIGEMFTLKRFMLMSVLQELGIDHFDAWAQMFGEVVTAVEMKPDGSGFRQHSRFARFQNVPELLKLFWQFADIQNDNVAADIDVPDLITGKPIGVSVEPRPEIEDVIEWLAERAENLGNVTPQEDNMLKIVGDAKKAALDLRLVKGYEDVGDYARTKVNACVANVVRIYEETRNVELEDVDGFHDLTQVVFLDMSTPKSGEWSVYQDIKDKLIAEGIPGNKITFAHDAKTDQAKKIQQDMINRGKIAVILASTEKAGIGVNMQRLLKALHHLDCPWKPAEIEQREGRIVRQGNLNKNVYIYRYVTEKTFDVYSWETVERKAKFIAQVMRGDLTVRSIEDLDAAVIGFAEMKALSTGNTAIIEKIKVESELRRLRALQVSHKNETYDSRRMIALHEDSVKKSKRVVKVINPVIKTLEVTEGLNKLLMEYGANLKNKCTPYIEQVTRARIDEFLGCEVWLDNNPVTTKQGDLFEADGATILARQVQFVTADNFEIGSFKLRQQEKFHAERNAAQLVDLFSVERLQKIVEEKERAINSKQDSIEKYREATNLEFAHAGKIKKLEIKLNQLEIELSSLGKDEQAERYAEEE